MGEKIKPPMHSHEITQNEIIQRLGEVINEEGMDDLAFSVFRPTRHAVAPNTIYVMRNGKQEYYRLDPELYKAVTSIDQAQANIILQLLSKPASWLSGWRHLDA